jgi:hypothetical protein
MPDATIPGRSHADVAYLNTGEQARKRRSINYRAHRTGDGRCVGKRTARRAVEMASSAPLSGSRSTAYPALKE